MLVTEKTEESSGENLGVTTGNTTANVCTSGGRDWSDIYLADVLQFMNRILGAAGTTSAARRQEMQLSKMTTVAVAGIVLPPLILMLVGACPGPPVLRRIENPWVRINPPGDVQYLHARSRASWHEAHARCAERGAFLLAPPHRVALSYGRTAFDLMMEELRDSMPERTSAVVWVDVRRTNDTWRNSDGSLEYTPEVWALLPVDTSDDRERCGFLYVFPKAPLNPLPNITLSGLLDGYCSDRREFVCEVNNTAR